MRNLANGNRSQRYQTLLVRGAIATLIVGGSLLTFGRDTLFFYNGPGGDGWKIGNGGVHIFNAHFDRDLEKARAKALKLVNRDREANGLPLLVADARLETAAQQHAEDMAQRNFLSNFSPEGKAPSDRFSALGGQGFVAENIGVQGEDEQVTYRRLALLEREWMYERRDRENLLNGQFNQFGFGIAVDPTDGEVYAVQLFRKDGTLAAQATSQTVTPSSQASTASANTTVAASDPFREAVNAATAASVAAQTAQTAQQWATVATSWNRAITNMKAVAPEHPRYATAQQKATEYGKNFDYARQNAGAAFAVQQPATTQSSTTQASSDSLEELPATEAFNDAEAWLEGDGKHNWSMWFKLLLTVGGAGALIFFLTLEPSQLLGNDKEMSRSNHASRSSPRDDLPWHRRAVQEVQKFLEVKGWFHSGPEYKAHQSRPVQRVERKLYRELLSLTQDEQAAIGLLKENMRRNPRKPVNWCCEQVIKELHKNMPPPSRSFRRAA